MLLVKAKSHAVRLGISHLTFSATKLMGILRIPMQSLNPSDDDIDANRAPNRRAFNIFSTAS
jgi:hypothetical protein